MSRVIGGGDQGHFLDITCVPDSTLATELAASIVANKKTVGTLVSLTFGANYQVTSPANNAIPDGMILTEPENDATNTYLLTVRLWSYIDQNSVRHSANNIKNLPYSGTIALQDSVIVNGALDATGTTGMVVDDGTTGGWGAVIAKDVPTTGYVDVLV